MYNGYTLANGKQVAIDKVEIENLAEFETTYNFEVADFHTYYVSESNVLVHNVCRGTQRKRYWKERAKDPDALGKYGSKNIDLMKQGKSPIIHGEKIELHHVEGWLNNQDWVVEVTHSNHIAYHKQYGYRNFTKLITETNIPIFYGG